jgi:hypothetical protein
MSSRMSIYSPMPTMTDEGFYSVSPSPPITDRLYLLRGTGLSSSGTLWVNVNSTSLMMVTPSGEFWLFLAGHGGVLRIYLRVSCVRFSPNPVIPVIVSCGWDKVVKVSTGFFMQHSLLAPATRAISIPLPVLLPIMMNRYICYFRWPHTPMRQYYPPRSLIPLQFPSFPLHMPIF